MTSQTFKTTLFTILCFAAFQGQAQQGEVTINQDKNINTLLDTKKKINKNENDSERYKIQIYSGARTGAQEAKKEFTKEKKTSWFKRLFGD